MEESIDNVPGTDPQWQTPVPGAHWLRDWRIGEWLSGPISPLFETLVLPRLVESKENAGLGVIPWHGTAGAKGAQTLVQRAKRLPVQSF